MTGYRQLARNHDFTVLWVGQTVSELGTTMSLFVFPLLAYRLSGSTLETSLVGASILVGRTIALLPGGVLADRRDRRAIMRATSAVGFLLYASLVVAGLLGALTVLHLGVVGLLTGIASGCFGPAEGSAVRTVVPKEDLPTALSQNQARQHVAALVGGPLGGVLYAVTRWLPFAVDAVSYAVSWLMLGRIRTSLAPQPSEPTHPWTDLREGVHFLTHHPFFRVLTAFAALANLTINAVFFVAILRLVQAHYPAWQIGLVDTAAGLGGLLGAVVAPWIIDRTRTGLLTVVVAWSFVPVLVPIALVNTPWAVGGALFVGLLLNPAGNAGISAYAAAIAPQRLQGRIFSSLQFLATVVMPLAPIIGGFLLAHVGGRGAILGLAVLTAVAAAFPTLSRHVRSVPRPSEWAAAEPVEVAV